MTNASNGFPAPLPSEHISETLEQALSDSPADETEIVWIELLRGSARGRGSRVDIHHHVERTIVIRVLEQGRLAIHKTCGPERGELAFAVRQAIAHSRVNPIAEGVYHLPLDESATRVEPASVFSEEIAALDPNRVQSWLRGKKGARRNVRLRWTCGSVAVFSSRGVRRSTGVTSAHLEVRMSRRPGAGRAEDASRRLEDLDLSRLEERARRRHGTGPSGLLPETQAPLLLSPEATVSMVDLLNRVAFSAASYRDETSLLREHLGVQVFHRDVNLRDDATEERGLPFPFDLEGTAKLPVDLVQRGAPKTPALDQVYAAELGLRGTGHSVSGQEAQAENLFLLPGRASTEELLGSAGDGIWIGWLDSVEAVDPLRLVFRARAKGARRISKGRLGEPLPDFQWEDSLLRALSENPVIGSDSARRLGSDGVLGGTTAPGLLVSPGGQLLDLDVESSD